MWLYPDKKKEIPKSDNCKPQSDDQSDHSSSNVTLKQKL